MIYKKGTVTSAFGAGGILQGVILANCTGGSEPGEDWTVEVNQNSKDDGLIDAFGATHKEVILSNTGDSGTEQIIVGMREWEYDAVSAYGLDLNVYLSVPTGVPPGWNAVGAFHGLLSYDSTYKHWDELPILQMLDGTMNWWLWSDKNHIKLILDVSNNYYHMYLGNGRRLGTPAEYPYPLLCIGSHIGNVSYQAGGYGISRPRDFSAGAGTMYVVGPGNVFYTKDNLYSCWMIPSQREDSSPFTVGDTPGNDKLLLPLYVQVGATGSGVANITEGDVVVSPIGCHMARSYNIISKEYYKTATKKYQMFQNGANITANDFVACEVPTTTTTT